MGRPPGSGLKGHVVLLLRVRPEQRQALQDLAEERRKPHTAPPLSEVAREALDLGIAALRKPGGGT